MRVIHFNLICYAWASPLIVDSVLSLLLLTAVHSLFMPFICGKVSTSFIVLLVSITLFLQSLLLFVLSFTQHVHCLTGLCLDRIDGTFISSALIMDTSLYSSGSLTLNLRYLGRKYTTQFPTPCSGCVILIM